MGYDDLHTALGEGDVQKVQVLIGAGADIHYKREDGYDALIDAVHGRDITRDAHLLEMLELLVAHRVDLSGVSAYGESGLRVLSHLGRFDAVRLLLDAGANKSQLEWTPLMEAVAFGSLTEVHAALAQSPALESQDCWSRTAWLIALLTGDIAKARLLRENGADSNARGRCGQPPLFYAIQGHHPEMLRWLLQQGADLQQTDDSGATALMEAVGRNDLVCVDILLDAGADLSINATYGNVLTWAESPDIILRLLDAGADPGNLSCHSQRLILGLQDSEKDSLAAISRDEFQRTFTRFFGKSNPDRMTLPFWGAMIRCGTSAYAARQWFEKEGGSSEQPVWCAQRFGQSLTLLPDGRAVQVGGEHEDWYDPDFCIYNDVFVHNRDGMVEIYGYPESVFPPTDFHTATLVDTFIYVIGSLGYRGSRQRGKTPVYRLDLRTLRIDLLDVGGEPPGWIYQHRAVLVGPHEIRVWGGKVITDHGDKETHEQNLASFVLDLSVFRWCRE
jgi:ankyrin repeat protein